jgi:hypothetical protein
MRRVSGTRECVPRARAVLAFDAGRRRVATFPGVFRCRSGVAAPAMSLLKCLA